MFHALKRNLIPATWALLGVLAPALPAGAEPARPWAVEAESTLQWTDNLQQQRGGTADLALRHSAEVSYMPVGDENNSALFRLQALNQRYFYNKEFDSTFLSATGIASRRLLDNAFGYGGYQFLYKQSDTPPNITRQDNDLFSGFVIYNPLSASRLVFHGYQFDFLRAAVSETSYQGHSVFVTLRDVTLPQWVNSASFRSQVRRFDIINELEWRNFVILESNYRLTDWWSLVGEVIYQTSTSSRHDSSFNAWNLGAYTRFNL